MRAASRLRRRTATSPARTCLGELAAELELRGWRASLQSGGLLLVANPAAVQEMKELIGCRQDPGGGGWEFCWSWGDPIAPVGQVSVAAERIQLVLRVAEVFEPGAGS